jgi:hypothetical protein
MNVLTKNNQKPMLSPQMGSKGCVIHVPMDVKDTIFKFYLRNQIDINRIDLLLKTYE